MPETSRLSLGRMFGIGLAAVPNHRSIVACRVSSIPSEATSFASGDDVRSGRNTSNSAITPTATAATTAAMNAGTVLMVTLKKPVFSAQKAYAATIERPPMARLMMPEPRYATTTLTAIPAITAPAPRPRSANSNVSFIARLLLLGAGSSILS